jgi:hypothetical protein
MFILILGMGRTGLFLAKNLIKSGHQVCGTVRAPRPVMTGIDQLIWNSEHDEVKTLPKADCVVCTFPPTLDYGELIRRLGQHFEQAKIILVSSTAVFGERQGDLDESTIPMPNDERSQRLFAAEQLILAHPHGHVVRAAGLYDDDRHPIHSLSQKPNIPGGLDPVNLVHREDVAEVISQLIEAKINSKIIHAVNPEHPIKQEYYTQKAKAQGLAAPLFISTNDKNRTIHSQLEHTWRKL